MSVIGPIRAAEDQASALAVDVGALNATIVTVDHLSSALQSLIQLAEDLRWDGVARRAALRRDLDETEVTIAAVDARLFALRKWEDLHDPDRLHSQRDLLEAATLSPLIETDHGLGFDEANFGELVAFVADMPW